MLSPARELVDPCGNTPTSPPFLLTKKARLAQIKTQRKTISHTNPIFNKLCNRIPGRGRHWVLPSGELWLPLQLLEPQFVGAAYTSRTLPYVVFLVELEAKALRRLLWSCWGRSWDRRTDPLCWHPSWTSSFGQWEVIVYTGILLSAQCFFQLDLPFSSGAFPFSLLGSSSWGD